MFSFHPSERDMSWKFVCVSAGHMMSSTFSPPSYLSFGLSRCEDLSGSAPFLLYQSSVGALRGAGAGLRPLLAPFHHHGPFGVYECPFEPAFIQKRNERERQRVRCVNQGYAKLRERLPGHSADKRLSKVETLRAAIRYIKYLQDTLEEKTPDCHPGNRASSPTT